jgi:putative ABC transport system ATP-binding protein
MPDYRAQVQYVPQRAVLLEGSVEENLRLPFSLQVWCQHLFDRERAVALLGSLGRDAAFLSKSATALSGGEGQILALVRTLLLQPSILLLDEPTSALDRQTTQQVEALVSDWLKAEGERACCWVSHDPAQQQRLGDRQFVLSLSQAPNRDLPDH